MSIKLISFDVWSTLVRANKTYKEARVALMASAVHRNDIATVKAAMDEADDSLDVYTIATGEQCGFEDRVFQTCKLLGVPEPDFQQVQELYVGMSRAFLAEPPALTEASLPETFAMLKRMGFKIAVNSNTGFVTADLMRSMLTSVGLYRYVDFGLFSDEMLAAKPSPRVFTHLCTISGASASEIVHVGDNRDTDYMGALDSGLHALLYNADMSTAEVINHLYDLPIHPLLTNSIVNGHS